MSRAKFLRVALAAMIVSSTLTACGSNQPGPNMPGVPGANPYNPYGGYGGAYGGTGACFPATTQAAGQFVQVPFGGSAQVTAYTVSLMGAAGTGGVSGMPRFRALNSDNVTEVARLGVAGNQGGGMIVLSPSVQSYLASAAIASSPYYNQYGGYNTGYPGYPMPQQPMQAPGYCVSQVRLQMQYTQDTLPPYTYFDPNDPHYLMYGGGIEISVTAGTQSGTLRIY